jgi:hypothetical protein
MTAPWFSQYTWGTPTSEVVTSSPTKEGDYDPRHSPLRPLTSLSTKVHDYAEHQRQFVASMPDLDFDPWN